MLDEFREKIARYEAALKAIRDLRCSSFRTYLQDSEDMRRIARTALTDSGSGDANEG
jgi:hypothetical protein